MSLTDPATLGEGDTAKLEMKLVADKEAKTLSLIDRGCGAPRARRAARVAHRLPRHPTLAQRWRAVRVTAAPHGRRMPIPTHPDQHRRTCAGMSKEDLINQLGTVAQSGTSSFIEARLPPAPPTLTPCPCPCPCPRPCPCPHVHVCMEGRVFPSPGQFSPRFLLPGTFSRAGARGKQPRGPDERVVRGLG